MVVGEDVAVLADDDPGSGPLGPMVSRHLRHLFEKPSEKVIEGSFGELGSVKGSLFNLGYLDIYHRRTQVVRQLGKGTRHDRWRCGGNMWPVGDFPRN